MTPSAASMMLKEIEGIFGAKLFRRVGRGMVPTEQGLALLPRCQTVLGEVDAMGASLVEARQPLLRLGAFPHTTTTVLPEIVRCLTSQAPAWRVHLYHHSADHLLQLLLEGRIDVLLGRLPSHVGSAAPVDDLAQQVLYQSELSLVARKRHPLAGESELSLETLLDWPWVLPSTHSTTRVAVVDAFLRQGLPPPLPAVESPSFFYSLSLVARTDMLSCCVRSAALAYSHETTILPIDISQEPVPVALIWRKSSAQAQRAMNKLSAEIPALLKRTVAP